MTEPRRPLGPRNPADAWAEGPLGRFWGLAGAAGLLAHDPARGVLLQHRVSWSDQGGTWGIPGGARHVGEQPVPAALREADEEAGVPVGAVRLRFTHLLDVRYWSYTTVGVDVVTPFEAVIGDAESEALDWVPLDDVDRRPLHPGFRRMWPSLRRRLESSTTLIVDVANVMGSRPDGWWRNRRGAAGRLLDQLAVLADTGVPGTWFGTDGTWHLWPEIVAVVEGAARGVRPDREGAVTVVDAPRDGDQSVVETALSREGAVCVVTSDRGLRRRLDGPDLSVIGSRTLLDLL